jgi:hypothetical protein
VEDEGVKPAVNSTRHRSNKRRAQSIVEFVLLLPLLLMLLSSLVEFGFALNEYLDLTDTSREVARYLADHTPIVESSPGNFDDRVEFYLDGAEEMERTLSKAGWISLDSAADDLVISIFSLQGKVVQARYPAEFTDDRGGCDTLLNGGTRGWRLHCNYVSKFQAADVESRISGLSSSPGPPNAGIVLVEIFYDYNLKLDLPWVSGIVGDTITFHSYAFAPNSAAEPD